MRRHNSIHAQARRRGLARGTRHTFAAVCAKKLKADLSLEGSPRQPRFGKAHIIGEPYGHHAERPLFTPRQSPAGRGAEAPRRLAAARQAITLSELPVVAVGADGVVALAGAPPVRP